MHIYLRGRIYVLGLVGTPGLLSSLVGVASAGDELPPVKSILSVLGVQVTNGLFSMCLQGLG